MCVCVCVRNDVHREKQLSKRRIDHAMRRKDMVFKTHLTCILFIEHDTGCIFIYREVDQVFKFKVGLKYFLSVESSFVNIS